MSEINKRRIGFFLFCGLPILSLGFMLFKYLDFTSAALSLLILAILSFWGLILFGSSINVKELKNPSKKH